LKVYENNNLKPPISLRYWIKKLKKAL
jgi:hypothetical protein